MSITTIDFPLLLAEHNNSYFSNETIEDDEGDYTWLCKVFVVNTNKNSPCLVGREAAVPVQEMASNPWG